MAIVEKEFRVDVATPLIWNVLNDPVELGKCILGCEDVTKINSTEAKWTIKINVGIITKRIVAKSLILESSKPTKLKLKLDSTEGDFSTTLTVNLEPLTNSTKVLFNAEVNASGSFHWIVEQVTKSHLDKMISEFVVRIPKVSEEIG